ncbi:MAG TPA: acyltransferase [Flavisolibacter sp.]|nr:acyltransferase [Flavisolibacter sp.]
MRGLVNLSFFNVLQPTARRAAAPPVQIKSIRPSKQIAGIQYLRGLAAIMVVFTHIGGTATIPKYFGLNLLNGAYGGGAAGVHLFFVISGFIIVYVSVSIQTLVKKVSAAEFLSRRFIRVIPFMWICVAGHAFLMLVGRSNEEFPIFPYLRSLFLFPIGEALPNQIWTIKHEVLFYLVFCVAILLAKRRLYLLLAWIVSPIFWSILVNDVLQNSTNLTVFGDFFFSSFNLLFGIGLLIGWLHLKGYLQIRWKTGNGFLVCLLLCFILFLAANWLVPFYYNKLIYNSALGLLSGAILLTAISVGTEMSSNGFNKLGILLGDASYSIYLTHCAIISGIYGIWAKFQKSPNPVLLVLVTGISCCVIGIVVHKTVEKTVIAFLQSWFGKKRTNKISQYSPNPVNN